MQKAINTLIARIEKLNEKYAEADKTADEPEMVCDMEFALNQKVNIQLEINELQEAIYLLKSTLSANKAKTKELNHKLENH